MRLPITGSLVTLAAVDAVQVWRAGLRYYRTDKWCVGTLRSFPNEIQPPACPAWGQGEALQSLKVKSAYLDGEVCALRPDGVPAFSRLQAAMDELVAMKPH